MHRTLLLHQEYTYRRRELCDRNRGESPAKIDCFRAGLQGAVVEILSERADGIGRIDNLSDGNPYALPIWE
jgi:hypothetical protein